MQRALEMARQNLGQTWPNPTVGAVIVKEGVVVGEGATARGGRPHAETIALAQAGERAKGATLYVTLEPCSHHGKTPPCTDAIINAGITRCVIACADPNPLVGGNGMAKLKASNIEIIEHVCEKEALEMHRGFFSVIQKKRPFIAMKIATSSDGKIAQAQGVRTQITGQESWSHTQMLRAQYDAILTGIGTVLADDPLLTVRIAGQAHRSPVRVVLDSQGRLPADSNLRNTEKDVPVWVYKREDNIIDSLTERGITRLLIEAGREVNTHFLKAGLVDRLYHYQAPQAIGKQGVDAVEGGLEATLADWQCVGDVIILGQDHCTIYEKV